MKPPRIALQFLRWFCREEYLEEIEGNLIEMYERDCNSPLAHARRNFTFRVLKHFRPEYIRSFSMRSSHPFTLLQHQLLIAFRSFSKYKSSFCINLIGLWSGLTCVLLIGLWVNDELSMDSFHEHDQRLFQVMERSAYDGGINVSESTPGLLADALGSDFSGVESSIGYSNEGSATISVNENNFNAETLAAGEDFFKAFSFKLKQGNVDKVLSSKENVVISESLAISLFGTLENVVGKRVEFAHTRSLIVSGVFADVSPASTLHFEMVYSWELWKEMNADWIDGWGNTSPFTFVLLKEGIEPNVFEKQIASLAHEKDSYQTKTFFLRRFSDAYLYGHYANSGVQSGGRIEYVRLFSIVGGFVLLIACINFINLSTARASRRMKEVGIKKVSGALRTSLATQFIVESVLITTAAALCSIATVYFILPYFNTVIGKQLVVPFEWHVVVSVFSIIVATGFLAGLYPAFYLSSFKPSVILRGHAAAISGERWIRQGLVVFQFSISIILITCVIVVSQQIEFIQTRDRGYDTDNVIRVRSEGRLQTSVNAFLAEVRRIPGVEYASTSSNSMVGRNSWIGGLSWNGHDHDVRVELVRVNYDLIEMMGISMKEGRSFDRNFPADTTGMIFNEAAIDILGVDPRDVIGETVNHHKVIGVAKNFHFESLHEPLHPMVLVFSTNSGGPLMMRLAKGREQEAIAAIEQFHKSFNPGFVFTYGYLSDHHERLYAAEQRVSAMSRFFAGTAIVISCLGLFGLAAFTAERRKKEIGIRKVLGSTRTGIVWLLTTGFAKAVLLSIIIALPVSYLVGYEWLSTFAYRMELSWWYFAVAGGAALVVAWFTVGVQIFHAASMNPTDSLRGE